MAKNPLSSKIRLALLKGMEAIGTSASNMASSAKLKASEINLENRRREILTNFSLRAFEMWQKGVPLPEPLNEMLVELCDIDDRLSVLRAQKYARVAATEQDSPVSDEAGPAQPSENEATCSLEDPDTGAQMPVPCEVQPTGSEQPSAETDSVPAPKPEEDQ